ncbi:carboxypeptidase D-like [Microcaecilia unicolor]|uniref:Carboxypeptidase D-like n=1 Tax=Microcaecilia unicolor TaxID=1415580 RepID=A0A6P7WNJ3_9AMPH|nr:carboxypeptidase D-like [Microcaecilia unicolor]
MAWGSFALLFALLSGVAAGPHIKKEMVESSERHNRYYHYEELRERLRSLAEAYPRQAQLFSIGQSVQGRELWVLRITAELHAQIPDRPQVKYVGNMHGDEAVSRQVLLYLADYLLRGYLRDPRLTRLLNTTDIYILPSLNPDGFENASEGDCTGNRGGRENARGRDLNRSFPDQFSPDSHPDLSEVPEVSAMINWIQSNRFLLSGNLHGGSVVASYPYDDSHRIQFLVSTASLQMMKCLNT